MNPHPHTNGRTGKLPPPIRAWIVSQSNAGKPSDEIAEALLAEHRIEVTARAVRRIIQLARIEQADAAKSVVRAELRTHLIPAIERIARAGRKAERLWKRWVERADKLREKNADSEVADNLEDRALRAMDRTMKSSIALLHYAGLDQPDDLNKLAKPAAERRAALLKRLEEIVKAPQLPPATEDSQVH